MRFSALLSYLKAAPFTLPTQPVRLVHATLSFDPSDPLSPSTLTPSPSAAKHTRVSKARVVRSTQPLSLADGRAIASTRKCVHPRRLARRHVTSRAALAHAMATEQYGASFERKARYDILMARMEPVCEAAADNDELYALVLQRLSELSAWNVQHGGQAGLSGADRAQSSKATPLSTLPSPTPQPSPLSPPSANTSQSASRSTPSWAALLDAALLPLVCAFLPSIRDLLVLGSTCSQYRRQLNAEAGQAAASCWRRPAVRLEQSQRRGTFEVSESGSKLVPVWQMYGSLPATNETLTPATRLALRRPMASHFVRRAAWVEVRAGALTGVEQWWSAMLRSVSAVSALSLCVDVDKSNKAAILEGHRVVACSVRSLQLGVSACQTAAILSQ